MFKTFHLGVLNFGFLSLCYFGIENDNFTPNSKTTSFPKQHSFSFEVKGKIGISLRFSAQKGQSERKSNFDTPK
jgi:hypothetical protein